MRFLFLIILVFLTGCKSSGPVAKYTQYCQPIVITEKGKQIISDFQIGSAINEMNTFWKCTDIQFKSLGIINLEKPEWLILDSSDSNVWKFLNDYAQNYDAIPILLCKEIHFPEYDSVWGLASYSSGFIAADYPFLGSTFAHEMGHVWGLPHIWEDEKEKRIGINDTPGKEEYVCNSPFIMSYCAGRVFPWSKKGAFSPDQIKFLQNQANKHLPFVPSSILTYDLDWRVDVN